MRINPKTVQHLDQELGFKKDNPGISRGFNNPNLRVFLAIEASIVQRLAAVVLSGSTSRLAIFWYFYNTNVKSYQICLQKNIRQQLI